MDSYNTESLGPDSPGPNSPFLGPRVKYTAPSLRQSIKVDPAASGMIIRYALAAEVVLNIFMGTALAVFPKWLLYPVMTEPSTLTPIAIFICQWVGAIIFAFSIQVALVIPNTRGAVESRRLVYWTLLAGECFLIPLFFYQSLWGPSAGLKRDFLGVTGFLFFGHMLWRLYCLVIKPHWFGRYQN
jgi:hypothetical protein